MMGIKFPRRTHTLAGAALLTLSLLTAARAQGPAADPSPTPAPLQTEGEDCERTVTASVVAHDQVVMVNRMGAVRPGGMVYSLEHDVVSSDGAGPTLRPGRVMLREGKRPRPLVLRMNAGDCLEILFKNLLDPERRDALQPLTRSASIHVAGLELVKAITDNGNFVGANGRVGGNESGLVMPGGRIVYTLYAARPGSFLLYSTGGDFNGSSPNQMMMGLFGAVNVQPRNSEWYRSQVTNEDLQLATRKDSRGKPVLTEAGHPVLDYDATYPADYDARHPRARGRACAPVLKMLDVRREPVKRGETYACAERPGRPQIYHGDLTAVITGPNAGRFPYGEVGAGFAANPALPDRRQPFREITVLYHESQDLVQPFPISYEPSMQPTLMKGADFSGSDSFAINYGVGGITSEIIANRLKVGPMGNCPECKFEEFFLSSWAVGDPAMVVDVPANSSSATKVTPDTVSAETRLLEQAQVSGNPVTPNFDPLPGPKATKAFFPDDPSNVFHTYLGDHVKFQILHAGNSITHVHHHHAHQWLHSPDSDSGHYLDSQAIGPGSSFTLDLVYNGSGNRNLTVGDSIFHCHLYPHFAAGMWGMFRVHDVFEGGTALDPDGRPAPGSRALPDGEIAAGTPIPALVPLPTLAMAPIPAPARIVDGQVQVSGTGNPGYPFFIPGVAGHRPPHPPLDFVVDEKGETHDGGLPRHLILDAGVVNNQYTPLDFSKDLGSIKAVELPEGGTEVERRAMAAHARRSHPSFLPDGRPGNFVMNGLPPAPGAPFADPAVDDAGNAVGRLRRYKGATFQVNAVFNKKGWHFPQQRMMGLWQDVVPTLLTERPPEPLFFRANTGDVIEYWHTNLVPDYYELDDFQVRTPTDIMGQHIHLVKFDVTSSDGAANGFNYEDGTFSPNEVRERIRGINASGGLWSHDGKRQTLLKAKPHPFFGDAPAPYRAQWLGAQTTVQRWYADPLLDNRGRDRTITSVFTHDHFGPSTHQQAGLYGGLLVEPENSSWTSLDGATRFGRRDDGGPTSYAANIITADGGGSYREFALMMQDLQLAYQPASRTKPDCYPGRAPAEHDCRPLGRGQNYMGWADPKHVINCPTCPPHPGAAAPLPAPDPPQPGIISNFGTGAFSLNYRNEPLPLRVNPAGAGGAGPADVRGDLSHVFRSIERFDANLNRQPLGVPIDGSCRGDDCFRFPRKPIAEGMLAFDPYTPLLRAYENDQVQIRLLVGGHTSMHDFSLHGVKWLFEPHNLNSGYRASQFAIISEHFEMMFKMPPAATAKGRPFADYLYNPSSSYEGLTNGVWGILRAYDGAHGLRPDLRPLPNNPRGSVPAASHFRLPEGLTTRCAAGAPCLREFRVSAVTVAQALGPDAAGRARPLTYNSRGLIVRRQSGGKEVFAPDPTSTIYDDGALVYVRDEDLDPAGRLKPGVPLEPLVLRANAGDWIRLTLRNRFRGDEAVFSTPEPAFRPSMNYTFPYAPFNLVTSRSVGLHPQLLAYDVTQSNGVNVGLNPLQTVAPGDAKGRCRDFPCVEYVWYAGSLVPGEAGGTEATPVEFGAVNLMPSDPLMHHYHGLVGGLIIEPRGAVWVEDPDSRASATVFRSDNSVFREFVVQSQNDIAAKMKQQSFAGWATPLSAFNYRTEPMFYRFGARLDGGDWATCSDSPQPAAPPKDWSHLTPDELCSLGAFNWNTVDTSRALSDELVAAEPQTPIFRAPAGMPVRFRLLNGGGNGDNAQVFELTGHGWQEQPYTHGSTAIGTNPQSQWTGTTPLYGATSHYDVVVGGAGGKFGVAGDYLYRSWPANQFQAGMWGVFRVAPSRGTGRHPDTVTIGEVSVTSAPGVRTRLLVKGTVTVSPQTRTYTKQVELTLAGAGSAAPRVLIVPVDAAGRWTFQGDDAGGTSLTVNSPHGGVATRAIYRGVPPPADARGAAAARGVRKPHVPIRRRRQQPRTR